MKTAEQILNELKNIKEISTLPQVMQRVMDVLVNEDSSAKDLAQEIAFDPAMTAKILKIVNSAFYGFYRRISSVSEAVVILGFREVRSLAITVSVFDMFGSASPATRFDRIRFWQHAIATGTVADVIRQQCCQFEKEAFVAGLLHDIGKIALDEFFCAEWNQILSLALQEERPISEVEQELLGITHAEVGYALCERWNLPAPLSQAVLNHHQEPQDESSTHLDALVYIANSMVKEKEIGFSGDHTIWPIGQPVRDLIGWRADHGQRIEAEMEKRMKTVSALLSYLES